MCLFCSLISMGQQSKQRIYASKDGLTCETIYMVLEDDKRFIWVATDNGIYKFDGQRFKRFSTENGLPDNDCHSIEKDNSGKLWVLCYNANICYIENDRVYSKKNDPALAKIKLNSHWNYGCLFDDFILFVEQETNVNYRIYKNKKIEMDSRKGEFIQLKRYNVLLGKKSITAYSKKNIKIAEYPYNKKSNDQIKTLNENCFVLFSEGKTIRFEIKNNSFALKTLPIKNLKADEFIVINHHLWTKKEKDFLYPLTREMQAIKTQKIAKDQNTINNIYQDFQGGFWKSTRGDELYYYTYSKNKYIDTQNGLTSTTFDANFGNRTEFFVATEMSVIQQINDNGLLPFRLAHTFQSPNHVITMASNKNHIICGTNLGNTWIYNRQTKNAQTLQNLGSFKQIDYVNDSIILASTSSSCSRINFISKEIQKIFTGRAISSHMYRENNYFIGTIKGIHQVYKDTIWKELPLNKSNFKGLEQLQNWSISDIKHVGDILIVTTSQKGIFLFQKNKTIHLTVQDGLIENNCKGIYIQNDTSIWVSSSSGISIISFRKDLTKITIRNLTKFNGLVSSNIQGIHFLNPYIYLVTTRGIVGLHKDELFSKESKPIVYITDVKVNAKEILCKQANNVFASATNSLELSLSAIDYRSEGNIRYAYRLKGLTNIWKLTSNKEIIFERLAPKKYILEVKAQNSNNQWSEKPARLEFEILPAWHQKLWVRILALVFCILLIGWLVFYFQQRRFQSRLKAEAQLKHLSEIELKAIKAQINPHFIFNTLNAIQYFIQNNENEKADEYLSRMSNVIRSTLNFSNETSIALNDEIDYLTNYLELESLRFDDDFEYSIIKNIAAIHLSIQIPTMVLQPHIENALKHGLKPKKTGKKILSLKIYKHLNSIYCEIKDNGIGRKKSLEMNELSQLKHASQGDYLANEKLALFKTMHKINATIEIIDLENNGFACGTKVILKIDS